VATADDGSSANSKSSVWQFSFILHTKHQKIKTKTKPKNAVIFKEKTRPENRGFFKTEAKLYFDNRTRLVKVYRPGKMVPFTPLSIECRINVSHSTAQSTQAVLCKLLHSHRFQLNVHFF